MGQTTNSPTQSGQSTNVPSDTAQPNGVSNSNNGVARIRGQTPDRYSNGTFGNSSSNRRTDASQQSNNRYSGQSTLAPTNGAQNYTPPNYMAPFNVPITNGGQSNSTQNGPSPSNQSQYNQSQGNAALSNPPRSTSPFSLPTSQGAVQSGLVSAPQQGYSAQSTYAGQTNPPPGAYQQPGYQQPGYQQPGYQQPAYQQPAAVQQQAPFDPYATTPQNSYNQNNFAGTGAPPATVPNNYQVPGQYNAGQYAAGQYAAGQYAAGQYGYDATVAPGVAGLPTSNENALAPGAFPNPDDPNSVIATQPFTPYQPRERIAPLDVYLQEARTGRVMLGGSVNSDLGLSGQLTIDERNFDITKIPTSWDDLWSGRAFRGRGQNFRAELMPGTKVQRYTVNWSERNFLDTPYSLSVGGFLYTRQFRDWTEQRLGGRVAVGYEITKDLTISTELRMEDVKIFNPRVLGVPQLDSALGSNDLYTGRIRLAHDTRDSPFMSSEGHLLELIYDQVFGEYDYPRGLINYNRYFLVHERPDQTGRHTLASTWKFGFSGSETPIFENFFAGGYSTLRGFRFRGASPTVNDVQVGGRFMALGSLEYVFPLTADEMLRGVAFVDYGTIEQDFTIKGKNIRVAPGLGLRIAVPALGPAPLAFDFAAPIQKADGDQTQVFSFFMGFTR